MKSPGECGRMFNSRTSASEIWTKTSRFGWGSRVAILLLGACLSASAKTSYVDSVSGNDANTGDAPATAWKSLTTAIGKLSAGDVLNCSGSWTITSIYSCATPNITLQGGGVSTLVIRPSTASGTLVFTGSGVTFKGFDIQAPYSPTGEAHALIAFNGNNSRLSDCKIHDFAPITVYDAVIFVVNANSCLVSNMFFYNMPDRDMFRVWGINNRWTSCTFSNCTNPNGNNGPHADLFQTWWTGAAIWSNVVERCYFVNSDQATFQLKGTPDNVTCHPGEEGYWTIRNNVFNNCRSWPVISTDNFRFYNNLLYDTGTGNGPTFLIADPCNYRGRYYNNVFIRCTAQTGSSPSYGYNAFTSSGLSWGGTGDFVTTEAACKFVNAAGGNFRLQAGSSLLGKGLNMSGDASMTSVDADGNLRPTTAAWDLGPYQYGASGGNQPPFVSAGTAVNLYLPTNSVTLNGSATDPEGATLVLSWSRVSGPAAMAFGSPAAAVTTATFPTNIGTYVLRLTASDGTNSVSADVQVTVNAPIPPAAASFEAESGTISAPFAIAGGAISQPVDTDLVTGGRAVYQFTVANSGSYTISAVVNAPNTSADSFFVNVDAEPADPYTVWDVAPLTSGFESRLVSWRGNGTVQANEFSPRVFTLSAGPHTLIVIGREPNALLDRFEVRAVSIAPGAPANLRVVAVEGFSSP